MRMSHQTSRGVRLELDGAWFVHLFGLNQALARNSLDSFGGEPVEQYPVSRFRFDMNWFWVKPFFD
jgi:hypothetical protein